MNFLKWKISLRGSIGNSPSTLQRYGVRYVYILPSLEPVYGNPLLCCCFWNISLHKLKMHHWLRQSLLYLTIVSKTSSNIFSGLPDLSNILRGTPLCFNLEQAAPRGRERKQILEQQNVPSETDCGRGLRASQKYLDVPLTITLASYLNYIIEKLNTLESRFFVWSKCEDNIYSKYNL